MDANGTSVYVGSNPDDWSEPVSATAKAAGSIPFCGTDGPAVSSAVGSAASAGGGLIKRLILCIVGILLILVGIPMLILPGPGVAAIGGGIFCLVKGLGFKRKV